MHRARGEAHLTPPPPSPAVVGPDPHGRTIEMSAELKLAALRQALAAQRQVVVAFSGGVDSAFLLRVAVDALGDGCHAVTAVSATMARSEVADARALGQELGLGDRHHV